LLYLFIDLIKNTEVQVDGFLRVTPARKYRCQHRLGRFPDLLTQGELLLAAASI
jgi:hypothetical protein